MSNQSEFDQNTNVFNHDSALNQNTADEVAADLAIDLGQEDTAFSSPLETEVVELTTLEPVALNLEKSLFPSEPAAPLSNTGAESTYLAVKGDEDGAVANSDYAVFALGQVSIQGRSDFDGDPLLNADDAWVYAGGGFNFKGNSTFPILRSELGQPILDADGKQQLLDNAVVVSDGYQKAEAKNDSRNLSGLIPPQVVEAEALNIPNYGDIVSQELANRLIAEPTQITFNA